jgi:hypothetical protein
MSRPRINKWKCLLNWQGTPSPRRFLVLPRTADEALKAGQEHKQQQRPQTKTSTPYIDPGRTLQPAPRERHDPPKGLLVCLPLLSTLAIFWRALRSAVQIQVGLAAKAGPDFDRAPICNPAFIARKGRSCLVPSWRSSQRSTLPLRLRQQRSR